MGFRNGFEFAWKSEIFRILKNMCSNADFIYEHEIYTILTEDYKWTNLGIELSLPLPLSTKSLYDIYYNPIKKNGPHGRVISRRRTALVYPTKFHSILVPVESQLLFTIFFLEIVFRTMPL